MVSFNRVNSALSTYQQRLSPVDLVNAAPEIIGDYNATLTSTLGKEVGQIENGFKALTQIEDYTGQLGDNLFGTALVALTSEVDGFLNELITDITELVTGEPGKHSAFTDTLTSLGTIAILTGTEPGNAFIKSVYGGSSSSAIANLMSKATGKNITQLLGVVESVQSASAKGFVRNAFNRALADVIGPVITEFNKKIDLTLGTAIDKVLQAVVDVVDSPAALIIDNLTGGKLKLDEINSIVKLLSNGKYTDAILQVAGKSSQPFSVVEETLLGIDTRVSTRITYTGSTTLPVFDIGTNSNAWEGVLTPTITNPLPGSAPTYTFTRVGGVEELEADFRSATRDITEVVVHWTGTYIDQDIGAEDVHGWHQARGWSGCGYHYVIRRDGTIERGRPINIEGAHALANGHNNRSIGVSFAAGYTVPASTGLRNPPTGKESITAEQMKAFDQFMNKFYAVWPGGQAFGHNDTDPSNKIDPGFSVPSYVSQKFGKSNIITGTQSPLTPAQIAQSRPIS